MSANPIIVVDYNAGNLTSVMNALAHIGADAKSSRDPDVIAKATRLIFPGVGAAASAMETLTKTGIGDAIKTVVKSGNPVLGICIGCQIILEESEEDGGVKTLGLIPGKAVRFKDEPGLKIPHMGWNQVNFTREHPIMKGIKNGSDFYYVHSYHPVVPAEYAFAETTYGTQTFQGIVGKDNLIATQFHQEKSGDVGLAMLKNFCDWKV
ncbi:MAG: imidazole glycerol phosphate synthase subunit HisH [Fibrobacter sp.]|jgi:glutamine amidotransferase|uniref:imidazole glycerol phosphate synthase subunit HisH n=1 Tax=unclassified Fibrobacter TaxID=2634177 RepID=UPI00091DA72F|nr:MULTISPECIES: imidazole glycerol phosphate synthase subunit HisH [unclassified Fibrobacter]MBO5533617.1 imidazole glycerol phosphate synthase subunit HisH [Fibrobacter sp.]MDY6264866.1 imidazole glycerol phosphate synthase subunit HisH [Fibrobacter sp.]SHK19943.1 glutamine amidotransferase [Fibrobacter sp. UWH4]